MHKRATDSGSYQAKTNFHWSPSFSGVGVLEVVGRGNVSQRVQGTLCNSVNNHPLNMKNKYYISLKYLQFSLPKHLPSAETTVLVPTYQ
jgi:hypothetical protein